MAYAESCQLPAEGFQAVVSLMETLGEKHLTRYKLYLLWAWYVPLTAFFTPCTGNEPRSEWESDLAIV